MAQRIAQAQVDVDKIEAGLGRMLSDQERSLIRATVERINEQMGDRPTPLEELYAVIFSPREQRLIVNCQMYEMGDPAGLPGHNLMCIISKLDELVGCLAGYLSDQDLADVGVSLARE